MKRLITSKRDSIFLYFFLVVHDIIYITRARGYQHLVLWVSSTQRWEVEQFWVAI